MKASVTKFTYGFNPLLVTALLFMAADLQALILYVDGATGNDAVTRAANTQANPWRTIGRAAWGSTSRDSPSVGEAAQAGDTVLVQAGIYVTSGYSVNSQARYAVALNPVNTGTAGSPITFRGVGLVEIRAAANTYGPLIGANGRSYIIWDHFTINDHYASSVGDTGPVVFYQGHYGQLINSDIQGHDGSYASGLLHKQLGTISSNGSIVTGVGGAYLSTLRPGDMVAGQTTEPNYTGATKYQIASVDSNTQFTLTSAPSPAWAAGTFLYGPRYSNNYNLVRIEGTNNVLVKNNTLSRVWGWGWAPGSGNANSGAVMLYSTADCVIENNTIADAGLAIFIKGQTYATRNYRTIARYNLTIDGGSGIRVGYVDDALVHQNIVYNPNVFGIWVGFNAAHGPEAVRARIINNTVYSSGNGGLQIFGFRTEDVHFKNNLVASGGYAYENVIFGTSPSTETATFNSNWYHNNTTFARYGESTIYTFATWQGTYGRDLSGFNGTDPLFVNAATRDFHLQAGSQARTGGRVAESIGGNNGSVIPVGAYITGSEQIGAGLLNTGAPNSPRNLRIVTGG